MVRIIELDCIVIVESCACFFEGNTYFLIFAFSFRLSYSKTISIVCTLYRLLRLHQSKCLPMIEGRLRVSLYAPVAACLPRPSIQFHSPLFVTLFFGWVAPIGKCGITISYDRQSPLGKDFLFMTTHRMFPLVPVGRFYIDGTRPGPLHLTHHSNTIRPCIGKDIS
jgi:hypothetical protein